MQSEKLTDDELETRKAGIGHEFLMDLMKENEQEETKKEPELDMIQLLDQSEHLFIKYA